jgi:3-(3-hydroxy-phenyl)propionate hydroxylase
VQDTDNLIWKLKLVLDGTAPAALLDSYDAERIPAADENIMNSTRSTDFITPKSAISRTFRDAVLELSENYPFARSLVNSGRLSLPYLAKDSPLNSADEDHFDGTMRPGACCSDAPVVSAGNNDWLLNHLGKDFVLLCFTDQAAAAGLLQQLQTIAESKPVPRPLLVSRQPLALPAAVTNVIDHDGLLHQRYAGEPGTCYLIRPDQHVGARWRRFDPAGVRAALARTTAQETVR